ncbi:MAG: 1,4-alpha-glucan branching protein domain-containing protein [candidate division WOR-3 bacterium]
MAKRGYFALVLHSHLPYVLGHGTWPHGAEWLYEAASETYIPLLMMLDRLGSKGIRPKFTIGITPILQEQLSDSRFQEGFVGYLEQKIDSAKDDEIYFRKTGFNTRAQIAVYWQKFYQSVAEYFDSIDRDIVGRFARYYREGQVDIITSGATHGYLPLLLKDESCLAQVLEGRRAFIKNMGKEPKGIWPPELAYRFSYEWKAPVGNYEPRIRLGLEEIYNMQNIEYFLVDHHLIEGGKAVGTYLGLFEALKYLWETQAAHYKPHELEKKDVTRNYYAVSPGKKEGAAVFARDPRTAMQVWSRDIGYPGDFAYLEFHKKHFPGGHRYWRITGKDVDLGSKDEYRRDWAEEALKSHSNHFVELIERIVWGSEVEFPIIVSPFDTELFGHWWFEGVEWIEQVFEKIEKSEILETTTLAEYNSKFPPELVINLPEGSWGEGGFHWVWLNQWTSWTWEKIYEIEESFYRNALDINYQQNSEYNRILKQLGRELLLLQSSDWQFLITTWSARDYAERRFSEHYESCKRLLSMLEKMKIAGGISEEDRRFLEVLEVKDRVFSDINPWDWRL